jgi:predicted dinucleotide-utilizing enzyme
MGGAAQVREQLAAQGAKSALVIGDTAANVKRMRAQLGQFARTSGLTVAQVQAQPAIVPAALKRGTATVVVTTGAFAATSPVWETLRSNADLSPETSVDYVPA